MLCANGVQNPPALARRQESDTSCRVLIFWQGGKRENPWQFACGLPSPALARDLVQNPPALAMFNGRFRSDREKTRKAEISRDFSRFFVPAFFRKNTDPFCDFFRPQGSEPAKTGFSKKSETELNSRKDLNPRHGSNPFGFFVAFTDCLQISDYKINPSELGEDLNPRCAQKQKLQNNSISPPVGFEPTKVLNLIVISLFSGLSGIGVVLCVVTGGDENEKDDR